MHMKPLRPAIAMIELIFAIVIMGIVMMSAPMLISTASKSTYVALQQEGINEAASRINMIMGYAWDENNTDDRYTPPILHVSSGNGDLNMSSVITARRKGTPMVSQRTFILSDANSSELNASSLGSDGGDMDDIDDFIGDISLTLIETATVDYTEKTTVNIKTEITYSADSPSGGTYTAQTITFVPFAAASGTTNIKSIEVELTSTTTLDELEKTIVLRAFSCNIGGYELKERLF